MKRLFQGYHMMLADNLSSHALGVDDFLLRLLLHVSVWRGIVTAAKPGGLSRPDCDVPGLTRADSHALIQRQDEDLAVADFAAFAAGGFLDGADG